jgi:hypothetical protein
MEYYHCNFNKIKNNSLYTLKDQETQTYDKC